MANWHTHAARTTRTAGRLFGEPVRLSFFRGGQVDPDRQPIDSRAQVHLPGEIDVAPVRSGSAFTTQIAGGVGLLIIQKADFTAVLLQGDKVRADSRAGQPWFEILNVDDKGTSQIVAQISLSTKRGSGP